MTKNTFLGEILYIISNYEKGRIPTSLIWKRQYVKSLRESIHIMTIIITQMKSSQAVTKKEMLSVLDFIKHNTNTIFPKSDIEMVFLNEDSIQNLFDNSFLVEDNSEILSLMDEIIKECDYLIKYRKNKYKHKISCLLRAFHNLPRVYLDKTTSFFNISTQQISKEDALKYASAFLNLKNHKPVD